MSSKLHQIGPLICLLALMALTRQGLIADCKPDCASPEPVAPTRFEPRSKIKARATIADLSEIRFRHDFRILVPSEILAQQLNDAAKNILHRDIELLEQFADEQFLLPVRIPVEHWQDLVPLLQAGHGDLIGAHMQIREYRERNAEFSIPVNEIREIVVTRGNDHIDSIDDLNGREIAISPRSSFWPRLHQLQKQAPDLRVRILAPNTDPATILKQVDNLTLDIAVLAPGVHELGAAPWQNLHAVKKLFSTTHLAFGIHANNIELKRALNDFLTRKQLAHRSSPPRTEDLDGITRHGVLRVITLNNAASYFIWRGRPLGFDYELMRRFADEHELSLEMVIAANQGEAITAVRDGTADVLAADLARDQAVTALVPTRTYRESQEFVVTRKDEPGLVSESDLNGRSITLHRSSPAWPYLQQLKRNGLNIKLVAVSEKITAQEIIGDVATGLYDTTVASDFSIKSALSNHDRVRAAFAIDDPTALSLGVRANNPLLRTALNAFLDQEYKQVFYNVIHKRYFANQRLISARVNGRLGNRSNPAQLSPYDDIVREKAKKYGFDWPLVIAIMFRESRFDPNVESWAGAKGLMQVLPVSAQRFGITDLKPPQASIIAGVRLLAWLYKQFDDELNVQDRTWFTLAAYNAGLGHLLDARRLARELDLDPDQWFGHVEIAMRRLTYPEYYRKSRHGYVRGIEPVTYVRDIRELYRAYKSMLEP